MSDKLKETESEIQKRKIEYQKEKANFETLKIERTKQIENLKKQEVELQREKAELEKMELFINKNYSLFMSIKNDK